MPVGCRGGRLYGLLGSGIGYSLSPAIHCTVFSIVGVDAGYVLWDTPREGLRERLGELRSSAAGFNVTIPFKEEIMGLLDGVDGVAGEIGAVNTVKNEDGALIGFNTDWLGVVECLRAASWRPRVVLLIGAGGAARAAAYAAARMGAEKLYIANRSLGRAEKLARWARRLGLDAEPHSLGEAAELASRSDTVVNATPLGSRACCPGEAPPVAEGLHGGQLVFDMVYNPVKTRLLLEAEKRGAVTVDGLCMLVWQALHADKIWLGIEPSQELYRAARRAALEALGEEGGTNGG